MNWINMLNRWQWLVMLALPPLIVLLYFLKLRRMPVKVPSTNLWRRTIEDLHVNSIWQRLRNNLLLLLQLLVILLLILACLRPGWQGTESVGERAIFLIDHSASMQAVDVAENRLQEAKRRALEMVEVLKDDNAGMVIAFSDRAEVKQGFTTDKRRLREAIQAITTTSRSTDMHEALRAASGLAKPGRSGLGDARADPQVAEPTPTRLYIYSDGKFDTPDIELENLIAEYIAIGSESARNVGILAFTVERNAERSGRIEAFARLRNFGSQTVEGTASLYLEEELVDAATVTVESDGETGVSFDLAPVDQGELRLELEIDDDFPLDNVAYAGLDPPRQLEVVLVTANNRALEAAFATPPAQALAAIRVFDPVELDSEELQSLATSGTIDLFVYDACSPSGMPESNALFLGSLPPSETWSWSEPQGPLFIIDTDRAHPMLQYVDMGTVRIVEGRSLQPPSGSTELLRTDAGILMAVAPRDAYRDAVLGMPMLRQEEGGSMPNTDWPIKRSFPVFVLNSLEYLGGAVSTAGSKTLGPGQSTTLELAKRFDRVQLEQPDGSRFELQRRGQPRLTVSNTEQLGFYRARSPQDDRLLQLFTVNLFSEPESDIRPRGEVAIGATQVEANPEQTRLARIEFWRWLLAFALIVLAAEWWLYNRRVAL